MNKGILLTLFVLLAQGKLFGQNCGCKIIYTSYDSVDYHQTMSLPKIFDYINDSMLIVKHGTAYAQRKFSFEDFEKDERPLKNDSFIIKNGELLQDIGGTQMVVYSPHYFTQRKPTYLYKFVHNKKEEYFEIIKFKYEPIRKEKSKGKTYFKYLSKTYSYTVLSKDIDTDSLRKNMLSIREEQFKTDHENDMYFYFVPGRGFLYDFCSEDLPLHIFFNQYKETPCCKRIIKGRFKGLGNKSVLASRNELKNAPSLIQLGWLRQNFCYA
jgi:hypothetical protein